MPIPVWEHASNAIISRLRNPAPLKLCVKTKNETEFLSSWIEHHAKIVGFENLIVADNSSTNRETISILEKYIDRVTVFSFSGDHNQIHWHSKFNDLFSIIKSNSMYFGFIDVDERLIWSDGLKWKNDSYIVDEIILCNGIIPTTWLINLIDDFTRFTLLDTEGSDRLNNNLRWGKPIIPSNLVGINSGIHNIQFKNFPVCSDLGTKLLLLHYTKFPLQRIHVNMMKLESRGLLKGSENPEDVISMDFSNFPDPTVIRFQKEISSMLKAISSPKDAYITENYVNFERDGTVTFSSDLARGTFTQFLADGRATIGEMFGSAPR